MKRQIPFLVALALIISVVMTTVMMYGCNKKEAAETVTETVAQQTETAPSAIEKDIAVYQDIIADLPDGAAYAFADMAEDQDALLVAEQTISFEGKLEASKAKVYAQDKDGNVKEMGTVESSTTSMPLMAFEHAVYFGSHSTMSKATINTKESKMEVETAKTNNDETDVANKAYNVLFEEYGRGTIIEFTEVQK